MSTLRGDTQRVLVIASVVCAGVVVVAQHELTLGYDALLRSGVLFGLTTLFVLRFLHLHPHARFGLANVVTLLRGCFTVLLGAFINEPEATSSAAWVLVVVATAVACADALDGMIARSSGLHSAFGARFDMEVDALFILVLCVLVFEQDKAGIWIIAIGAMRYVFVVSGWIIAALGRQLPPSKRRQTVCVIQVAVLISCLAPVLERPTTTVLVLAALCLLVYSFARDIHWLLRLTAPLEKSVWRHGNL